MRCLTHGFIYCFRLSFPVLVLCIYLSQKQIHRALPGIFIPDGYNLTTSDRKANI